MQARTGDTALVKAIERWQVGSKHCRGSWGERGKDDRKQNTVHRPRFRRVLVCNTFFVRTLFFKKKGEKLENVGKRRRLKKFKQTSYRTEKGNLMMEKRYFYEYFRY